MAKRFADLTEQEILALAITNEEEDSRIYGDIAEGLRGDYPATAKVFEEMKAEEAKNPAATTPQKPTPAPAPPASPAAPAGSPG